MVICSMSCTLALTRWVGGCVCVRAQGERVSFWEAFNISDSLQNRYPDPPSPPLPLPDQRKDQWSHLQVLMDYTAASILLRQCYWWMRFSVIHRASLPEECCLIVKWWMSVKSCFSEPCGFDVLCRRKALPNLWSLWCKESWLKFRVITPWWLVDVVTDVRATVALIGSCFQ